MAPQFTGGRTRRHAAGHARHADSEALIAGPAHGHTIATVIEQGSDGAAGRTRVAVSRAASSRLWPDRRVLGNIREQPQGQVLPDHAGRAAPPARRAEPVAAARRRGDAGVSGRVRHHAVATLFRTQRARRRSRRKSRITSRRRPTTTSARGMERRGAMARGVRTSGNFGQSAGHPRNRLRDEQHPAGRDRLV